MKTHFYKQWMCVFILSLYTTLSATSANNTCGYEYTGNIGPYKIVINIVYFNMPEYGPTYSFSYRYINKPINRGNWIECTIQGHRDGYEYLYEWINEKHTGTFKIIINDGESIKGTFINSKREKFDVYACCTDQWDLN